MLATSRLQTLVWTSRKEEARLFYCDVLGLPLRGESHGALVYDVGGCELRVSPVPETAPSAHTVVGFSVADVPAAVAVLASRGVAFEHFSGFQHDETGVWSAPDGAKVAWFRDPDGNLLSVVQYASVR
ncbi:MAG: VOC family protein [Proteobacteria bacterium]|nr:VOC family protein [Pseudomonadota bacterium]